MVITLNLNPSTCRCIITVEINELSIQSLKSFINKCPEHSALTDQLAYATILEEQEFYCGALDDIQHVTDNYLPNGLNVYDSPSTFTGTGIDRVVTFDLTKLKMDATTRTNLEATLSNRWGSRVQIL